MYNQSSLQWLDLRTCPSSPCSWLTRGFCSPSPGCCSRLSLGEGEGWEQRVPCSFCWEPISSLIELKTAAASPPPQACCAQQFLTVAEIRGSHCCPCQHASPAVTPRTPEQAALPARGCVKPLPVPSWKHPALGGLSAHGWGKPDPPLCVSIGVPIESLSAKDQMILLSGLGHHGAISLTGKGGCRTPRCPVMQLDAPQEETILRD